MSRIKIKDLMWDLEELKKKDPEILKKVQGGVISISSGIPSCYCCITNTPNIGKDSW